MGAYVLRRLLADRPTLFGIMLINFALTQFVPGGPIEQIIAQMEGEATCSRALPAAAGKPRQRRGRGRGYIGARGLPPDFIAELEAPVRLRQAAGRSGSSDDGQLSALRFRRKLFPLGLGDRSGA
jgi:microcin C transport system permease protein